MDINKKLNDIMLKYQLDRAYPRFRKKLLGEKRLKTWAEEIEDDKILCIGADQEDINYFSHLFFTCGKEFSYCLFSKVKEEAKTCDRIVVISKILDEEKIFWCMQCGKPVIFLYDYLEQQGIYCEDEIHKIIETDYSSRLFNDFPAKKEWRETVLLEFYVQRKKFALADGKGAQLHYARKLFFLSLYIRNFVQAEKYQRLLSDGGDLSAVKAWDEIQSLLTKIRNKLRDRKQADIVMVWMDAVSYGTGHDMPFLQEQIKNGISFENAFTVTPRTNPTAQALFLGKKLIDDCLYLHKEIREEESPVLLDLKSHGYGCRVISGYLSILGRKLQSPNYHSLYAPCSEIFWDLLYNLLSSEDPVFLLAHALTEGHAPHLTTQMEYKDFFPGFSRIHHGHVELDEQMRYYMEFLNKKTIKIFMSDHGQHLVKEQFHTYFVIAGERFHHRMAKELFSYVDFSKLLHGLLEGDNLEYPLFDREYVEVQMLDFYNFQIIKDIIQNKKPIQLTNFGYFGVITKEYLYLKYHIGGEFLALQSRMDREPHFLYQAHNICDVSMLPYFRKIIRKKTLDISADEKFRYTRYLYQVYENFNRKREIVFDLVNRLFEVYSEESIALRMGGEHSLELFYVLSKENQKKLAYIIDNNPNCACRSLGLPVISPNDIEGKGIQAVVLSSFDHLERLRREISGYPKEVDVIDIYRSLEASKIICETNFYAETSYLTDDIYEVGFPFNQED